MVLHDMISSRSSDYSSWSSDIFSVFSQALDDFPHFFRVWCFHHIPDHACLGFSTWIVGGTGVIEIWDRGELPRWSKSVNQSPPDEFWRPCSHEKLRYPLKISVWKMKLPFQPAPFFGDMQIFGVYFEKLSFWSVWVCFSQALEARMAERLQAWRVFEGMGMVLPRRRESASKNLLDSHLWYQLVHLAAVGRDLALIYVSKHATSHAFGRRIQLDLVRQIL